jgi:hypothetical protein
MIAFLTMILTKENTDHPVLEKKNTHFILKRVTQSDTEQDGDGDGERDHIRK